VRAYFFILTVPEKHSFGQRSRNKHLEHRKHTAAVNHNEINLEKRFSAKFIPKHLKKNSSVDLIEKLFVSKKQFYSLFSGEDKKFYEKQENIRK
jgi:hypothetical protein